MKMKKWLLTGACASMMGGFVACSSDDSNPAVTQVPVDPGLSSAAQIPGSSTDQPVTGSSSSAGVPVVSSSSIADTDNPQMACSEIMYNAPDGSLLEWVEVYIAGGMDMDNMANFQMHLSGAVDFNFPEEPLTKGEYIVVTNDTALFRATYPIAEYPVRLFGNWVGKLVNEGDVVNVKVDGEGDVSCAFGNEPPWPSLADGKGHSLVYLGGNAAQPNSWGASEKDGGNPGVGNDAALKAASVRINEIKPFVSDADHSWLELYNAGDTDADVSGWTVEVKLRKDTLTIKAGTVVPSKGYLVLDGVEGFDKELVLAPQGGEFYLRGPLPGEESSLWVPANTGTSGVVDLSDGSTAQGPLSVATPGAKNAPLQIGSVYINEIHYHPDEASAIPFEFMEIVNATAGDVNLSTSAVSRGWKVEGINLEFSNTVIPANGMILLIPAALDADVMQKTGISQTDWGADFVRTALNVPADVQIVTYLGKLSNRSETIAIKQPYSQSGSGENIKYYYIWHDATLYSDNWPAHKEADGFGYSLHRVDFTTMGYEASAWTIGEPTPGIK